MNNDLFGKGKTIALFSMQDVAIDLVMIEKLRSYGFRVVGINK